MSQPGWSPSARFSASDAAFAGFAVLRRAPLAVALWGVFQLVLGLATSGLMLGTLGPQLAALRSGATGDPAQAARFMATMSPIYLISFIATPFVYGVLFSAINRAVLTPADKRLGYVRFGVDELLQAVLLFIFYFGFMILLVVLIIGVAIISVILGFAMRGWAAVPVIFIGFAAVGLVFWLMVRLSMASPMTTDTHALHLLSSFRMTRGRFWALFGAYALAFIFAVLVLLVWLVVLGSIGAAVGGGLASVGRLFRPDTTSLAAYLSPLMVVNLLLTPFVYALQFAVMVAAPASAYAQLKGDPLAEVF